MPDKEQSPSVTELVATLRGAARGLCSEDASNYIPRGVSAQTCLEAAARLEALHAEREKLREAVGAFLICIRDLPKDSLARKAFSHVENLSRAALSIGEPLTDSSHGGEK